MATHYVSSDGSGTACTLGEPCTLEQAKINASPGDTIILNSGIYQRDTFTFGPAGTSPSVMTIWKAANGARPIITSTTNEPPDSISWGDYMTIDGIWFGGSRIETPTGIFMGGSPISKWKQMINCTIFGYADGIEVGSAEYYLIQNNRFVDCGEGNLNHCIYASGNDNHDGTETNHGIIDNNLFVAGGGGYAVHCFPSNKSMIVTRNGIFGLGSWGIAAYGKAFLVANNFVWKGYRVGGIGTSIGINPNIDSPPDSIIENNIVGPNADSFLRGDLFTVTTNASIDGSIYGCPGCINTLTLSSADNAANLSLSTAQIDSAVSALAASFAADLTTILNDATIETNFTTLRMTTPGASPLYQTGVPWFDANPINIGPDSGAPSTVNGFWETFNTLGLKNYDANGNLYAGAGLSGQASLSGKISF